MIEDPPTEMVDVTDVALSDDPRVTDLGVRDTIDTSPGMKPVKPPAPVPPADDPSSDDAVAAPAVGHRHKLHRRRTRPWRTAGIALCMVLLAGAIPALGAVAAKTIVDSREGRLIERKGRAADIYLPLTPAQLLIGLDAQGAPETIAVASLRPGGEGGYVTLIPTLVTVNVPGVGEGPLGSAFAAGGVSLLRQTVESMLDIKVEQVSVLDAATWPTVVTGSVSILFDDPIGTPGPDGRLDVIYPSGPTTLRGSDLPVVFGAHGTDQTEAARLVLYQQLWESVLTSIEATTPPPPSTSTTVPTGDAQVAAPPLPVDQFLAALAAGPHEVQVLPVRAAPGEPEAYTADEGAMRLLVAETMPGAVSPPTNSARIRLVNTTGDPQAMLVAADLVLILKANLVIASDDAEVERTQVLYAAPGFKGAAEFLADSLGVGTVSQDATVVDGIDLTVVLGTDFEDEVAKHEAAATTTTSIPTQETSTTG